jgi:hypothetical protein
MQSNGGGEMNALTIASVLAMAVAVGVAIAALTLGLFLEGWSNRDRRERGVAL